MSYTGIKYFEGGFEVSQSMLGCYLTATEAHKDMALDEVDLFAKQLVDGAELLAESICAEPETKTEMQDYVPTFADIVGVNSKFHLGLI